MFSTSFIYLFSLCPHGTPMTRGYTEYTRRMEKCMEIHLFCAPKIQMKFFFVYIDIFGAQFNLIIAFRLTKV